MSVACLFTGEFKWFPWNWRVHCEGQLKDLPASPLWLQVCWRRRRRLAGRGLWTPHAATRRKRKIKNGWTYSKTRYRYSCIGKTSKQYNSINSNIAIIWIWYGKAYRYYQKKKIVINCIKTHLKPCEWLNAKFWILCFLIIWQHNCMASDLLSFYQIQKCYYHATGPQISIIIYFIPYIDKHFCTSVTIKNNSCKNVSEKPWMTGEWVVPWLIQM